MSWVLGRSLDYKVYWLHFSFLSYCIIFLTLYFRESICHTLVILLFVGCRGASIIPGSVRTAWSGSGLAPAFAVGLVKGPDNSRNTNAAKKTKTTTNLLLVKGTSRGWNHVLTSCYIPVFSVGRSLACWQQCCIVPERTFRVSKTKAILELDLFRETKTVGSCFWFR